MNKYGFHICGVTRRTKTNPKVILQWKKYYKERGDVTIYITNVVGDSYKNWLPVIDNDFHFVDEGKNIIINAGTGTGKTTLAINKLINNADSILYLTPRKALRSEIINRIESDQKCNKFDKKIEVLNYQTLESWITKGMCSDKLESIIYQNDLIIVDEYHYFTQDSDFNQDTHWSYDFIKNCRGTKLFMSATGEHCYNYILKPDLCIDEVIEIDSDYNHINDLYFFSNQRLAQGSQEKNDFVKEKLISIINEEPEAKCLYFVNNMQMIEELYNNNEIRAASKFYFSKSQPQFKEFERKGLFYNADTNKKSFDSQLLIATTALDVGIDIKDIAVKYIFIDVRDINLAIQCLGRKRPIDENDKCTVYIHDIPKGTYVKEYNLLEKAFIKAKLEMERLKQSSFSTHSELYKKHISNYAYDKDLEKYNCTYVDWVNENGILKFNRIRFARIIEKYIQYNRIIRFGYKNLFNETTGLENSESILNLRPELRRNTDALETFLAGKIGQKLERNEKEKLAQLCCVPNSRKNGYLKQAAKLNEFLLTNYQLIIETDRKGVWRLKKYEK